MGTKPLHIFKPGRHTAMSGQALSFSEADLQATVAAYDPARHEAPLVVGHPSHDLPAYGWVQSLAYSEAGLEATPAQVNPEFAELVAAGAFKKISAAFYAPDAPNNPVPGVYYLRHVGFLGAQPPAIKGLRNPSFGDAEEGVLTFSEWDDMTSAGLWRNLREWILGKFGAEEADKVLPNYDVRALELGAQEEINKTRTEATPLPAFADTASMDAAFGRVNLFKAKPTVPPTAQESIVTDQEAAQLRAANEAQARRIAELEAAATAARQASVHQANVAFCDGLVTQGRLLPAARDVVVATLDHLAAQPTPVEFGEGEAKIPLAEGLKAMLAALPKAVEFGESATRERAAGSEGQGHAETVEFGENADPERLKQHKAIQAHMAAHQVDYATAARAVIK